MKLKELVNKIIIQEMKNLKEATPIDWSVKPNSIRPQVKSIIEKLNSKFDGKLADVYQDKRKVGGQIIGQILTFNIWFKTPGQGQSIYEDYTKNLELQLKKIPNFEKMKTNVLNGVNSKLEVKIYTNDQKLK